jgi:hypothetical protein
MTQNVYYYYRMNCRFWFVIISIIGGLALIYRLVLLFFPGVRNTAIRQKVSRQYMSSLNEVLQSIGYSDWFVLNLISNNVNSVRFGELCVSIKTTLYKRKDIKEMSRMNSPSPSPPPHYPSDKLKFSENDNENDNNSGSTVPLMTPP